MTLPTYANVAVALDIKRCRGVHPLTSEYDRETIDHEGGFVDWRGYVHWSDRKTTRAGLYRFLKLTTPPLEGPDVRWIRLYVQSLHAYELGLKIGIRFMADDGVGADKAAVADELVKRKPSGPLAERARKWSLRR